MANHFEQVLKAHPNVRFAAVIGPGGKILKGGMRANRKSLEPESKAEQLYLDWTRQHRMGDDWSKYLGRRTYLLDKRERVNIYTFNVDEDHILLVSTDPVSTNHIGDEILTLLGKEQIVKVKSPRKKS